MAYGWKNGSRVHLDAQVAGERLEVLRRQNGRLEAEMVVQDARPEDSPLHDGFEWDDPVAAEKYRQEQARSIIRSVVVLPNEGDHRAPVRAFVVVNDLGDDQFYTSTYVALSDERLRQQVLSRALRELHQWEQRYQELTEFADVLSAVRTTRERLAG